MKTLLKNNFDAVLVFVLMLCIFFFIVFFAVSDMSDHAYFARRMLAERKLFSNNFLLYLLINIFSGFSGTIHSTKAALVLLLSASNTAKYIIVKKTFEHWCNHKQALVASLALLIVFVVPILFFLNFFGRALGEDIMYLGYCVPNVWHNSTILCMMPFAILTYLLSVKQLEYYDKKRNGLITLFVILGTLIKPSFFFIYAVAYPNMTFVKYRWKREFFYSLVPILCGCACVLYEYFTIYTPSVVDVADENNSGVIIEILPLFTYDFWKVRLLKLGISLFFPMAFVVAYWKKIVKNQEFWLVFIMLVMALGISWCCQETGPRAGHGNFAWQVIPSIWFVYYFMLKTIVISDNEYDDDGCHLNRRGKIFLGIYSIHVFMGIFYLIRYFATGVYY